MSRFASEFFEQSPALLYPLLALLLFFVVFVGVVVRVMRMKRADAEKLARIPLEDQPVEGRDE
ncbi:MAG: CcoQ/FixQ family Cbb3-type cytochrome c oxidase assembly chaperone [Polyangiales bacterium]